MNEMLRKVCCALLSGIGEGDRDLRDMLLVEGVLPASPEAYEKLARHVLKAIREPMPEMIEAGVSSWGGGEPDTMDEVHEEVGNIYQAMIDKMLAAPE